MASLDDCSLCRLQTDVDQLIKHGEDCFIDWQLFRLMSFVFPALKKKQKKLLFKFSIAATILTELLVYHLLNTDSFPLIIQITIHYSS